MSRSDREPSPRDNRIHEEWETLVALAALGGLDEEEQLKLKEHLPECADCQRLWQDYRLIADELATNIPIVEAPPHLESKLRQQLRREKALAPFRYKRSVQTRVRMSQPRRRGYYQPAWWVAIAAILVALVLGVQNLRLRDQLSTEYAYREALSATLATEDVRSVTVSGVESESIVGNFINPMTAAVIS